MVCDWVSMSSGVPVWRDWALQTMEVPVLFDWACWTVGVPVLLDWAFAVEGSASKVARLVPIGETGFVGPWALMWHCFFISAALARDPGVSVACNAGVEALSCSVDRKRFPVACMQLRLASSVAFCRFLQHRLKCPMCLQNVQIVVAAGHAGDLYRQLELAQPKHGAVEATGGEV